MSSILFEEAMKIIEAAGAALAKSGQNPPGWEDKSPFGGAPGDVSRMPRPRHGMGGEDDASVVAPTNPGFSVGHLPDDPPGWSPRTYAYGDMASVDYHHVLTEEQAQSFQLMMNILNHNGDTVGRGGIIDYGPHNAPLRDKNGHLIPQPGALKGTNMWGRPSGNYFNGMLTDGNMKNPLAVPFNGFTQGFSGEQGEGTPYYVAPAPYGYTPDGRPRQYPGQTDDLAQKVPISKYAPGREYGPTVNKYKPTPAEEDAQSHDKRMM